MANQRHAVTGEARLSYVSILKPRPAMNGAKEEYSLTALIPKSDVATKQRLDAAIEAAAQDGVKSKWQGRRPSPMRTTLYDGDGMKPDGITPYEAECRGHWILRAKTDKEYPPRVVDEFINDVIDARKVYSGVYGKVGVDFFPYSNSGNNGIGCSLSNVQILRDGDPLDGRTSAEDDFGAPQGYQMPAQQPPQYATSAQMPTYQPPQISPITGLPM